jgi:hypothetical protein
VMVRALCTLLGATLEAKTLDNGDRLLSVALRSHDRVKVRSKTNAA